MSEDTKPCPACGELIKSVAVKCRFCGTDIAAFEADREAQQERILFIGRPAVLFSVGQYAWSVLTLGVAYVVFWIRSKSTRFEVTSQRVRVERGLLSTTKDNVELFRIDHFDLVKPLGMRVVGQCALHLRSSDPGFSTIELYGIPGLEVLADTLRECSLRERARRRVTTIVRA